MFIEERHQAILDILAKEGSITTADPSLIAAVVELHQTIVDNRDSMGTQRQFDQTHYAYVEIEYSLPGGMTLSRSYHGIPFGEEDLADPNSLTSRMEGLLQDTRFRSLAYNIDELSQKRVILNHAYVEYDDPISGYREGRDIHENVQLLWEAVKLDFRAGHLGGMTLFDPSWDPDYDGGESFVHVGLNFLVPTSPDRGPAYRGLNCTVTKEAVHTLAALRNLGIPVN